MGVVFALFLTPVIAGVLLINLIFHILGWCTLGVGCVLKYILHNTWFNMVANIVLMIGFTLLWLSLFPIRPLLMAIICIALCVKLLYKDNVFVLKRYAIMSVITMFLSSPICVDLWPPLQFLLWMGWLLFCFLYFVSILRKRIVSEAYSGLLAAEGIISLIWFMI